MLTAKIKSKAGAAAVFCGGLCLLLLLPLTPLSAQVTVELGDGSGTVGDIITVPVTVDDVTGLGIYAFELEFQWTMGRAVFLDVLNPGTLTAAWTQAPELNISDDRVRIVMAGATPLAGTGTLIDLQFELGPIAYDTSLYQGAIVFNEGDPPAVVDNGYLDIAPMPTINVYPNSGELAVGETQLFTTNSGVEPYSYETTDPGVADFSGGNIMTGLAPGRVQVMVQDAAAIRDTTSGYFDIRAVRLSAGEMTGVPGQILALPLTISDPSPFGLVSCEFQMIYDDTYLRVLNVEVKGTVAEDADWQAPEYSLEPDLVKVALAGASPLGAAGTLVFVYFEILDTEFDRNVSLYPQGVAFNEDLPAVVTNGRIMVDALPTLSIYPSNVEMTVGEVVHFYTNSTYVAPLIWGVTDPAVASISAAGDLTGLSGGVIRVTLIDDDGATGISQPVTVCELMVSVANDTVYAPEPVMIAVRPDRNLDGLDIWSLELNLSYDTNKLSLLDVHSLGTATAPWGAPIYNDRDGDLLIVSAGMIPLIGDAPLFMLEIQPLAYTYNQSTMISLDSIRINEGDPCALVEDGRLWLLIPSPTSEGFGLVRNHPNPFNPQTTIAFALDRRGAVWLRIYALDGKLVQTLIAGETRRPGLHDVMWDGRDRSGKKLASGTYISRLEANGRVSSQRMLLVR